MVSQSITLSCYDNIVLSGLFRGATKILLYRHCHVWFHVYTFCVKVRLTGTDLSIFIETRAALGFPPVHGLLTFSVGRPIAHPAPRQEVTSTLTNRHMTHVFRLFCLIINISFGLCQGCPTVKCTTTDN